MLNHARTLLLNMDGRNNPGPDFFAEELVPEEYRVLSLPTYLTLLRSRLFGVSADRAMLNYRIRQLLALLHATPLVEFVTALDNRITYAERPLGDELPESMFAPQVQQIGGPSAQLYVVGSPDNPDFSGQMRQAFTVNVLGDTVKVTRNTAPIKNYIWDLDLTSGLSATYDLPGYGYQFRINTTDSSCSWQISGYLRPQLDLGQIAANLTNIGETITVQLFGVTNAEPWATFRNLWLQHKELPYRLGGLLLAMIYRTEELRNS